MRRPRARAAAAAAAFSAAALGIAACGVSSASTTSKLAGPTGKPITVGLTLSKTGAFQTDGLACEKGYELWASDVNAHGGLLGRPVKLIILNDNSDPNKAAAEYATLMHVDHVDLLGGPFSSLITDSVGPVTKKYGYAFPEGSGGAPSVFSLKLHNLFAVSAPIAGEVLPFAHWVSTLPAGKKPLTAAYPMVADPFADPPVKAARTVMQGAGIHTVYSQVLGNLAKGTVPTTAQLVAAANTIARRNAQAVVLGSVDVPTVATFVHTFIKDGYNPKYFIATSGPDQGQAFLNKVGTGNATGIMVPNGWYGGYPNALSHVMVQDYIAKFGGTASDINADVAESYSVGQVLAEAVTATRSLNQAKIIAYLHSHTMQTVQGPVAFNSVGANTRAVTFIFQWQSGAQFLEVLSNGPAPVGWKPGLVRPIYPKPPWAG
jgi:branched-chain amino acid transport system substrate-binding protein